MEALLYLIPVSLLLGGIGLYAFMWTLDNGQYDDMEGSALRILIAEDKPLRTTAPSDEAGGVEGGAVDVPGGMPQQRENQDDQHQAAREADEA